MFFAILNIFFQVLIVVLLVRYFIEPYRYYGFGPILVAVVTLTEKLLKPIKRLMPQGSSTLQDNAPLFAILVVIFMRGLILWPLSWDYPNPFLDPHRGLSGGLSLGQSIAVSCAMGVELITILLIAFLFASLMISRRGVQTVGSAGFTCFRERTFTVFQFTRRYVPTNSLVWLFVASALAIWFIGALGAVIANGAMIYGVYVFQTMYIVTLFNILMTLITVYWFVLLVAIICSWIGADQFSLLVQLVRSMADPYLDIFRRLLPWARIDFLDLSPIFGFLLLNPILIYVLYSLQQWLLLYLRLGGIGDGGSDGLLI